MPNNESLIHFCVHSFSSLQLVDKEAGAKLREELRNAIPSHAFQIDTVRSTYYLLLDYIMLYGLAVLFPHVRGSYWTLIPWQIVTGSIAWGMFLVGHDAGHTTFSNIPGVNEIAGHLAHTPIAVPFWPWKKSHSLHHAHHNHEHKDMSHHWRSEKDFPEGRIDRYLALLFYAVPVFTFTGAYLFLGKGRHTITYDVDWF